MTLPEGRWLRVEAVAAIGLLFGLSNCAPVPQRNTTPNSPLRILSTRPESPVATFFRSSNCQALNPEFQLTVDGADPFDVVSSLWFIDRTSASQPFRPTPVPGGPVRKIVRAPVFLAFSGVLSDQSLARHALTVFVSDGVFDDVVADQITASRESREDGGAERLQASVVSFNWTLEMEPCP